MRARNYIPKINRQFTRGAVAILCFLTTLSNVNAQITLVLQPDAITGKDAAIIDNQPNVNWGNYEDFIAAAWTNSGVPHLLRSFIDFDISSIPVNSTILDAHLSLYSNPQSWNAQLHSSLSGSNVSELHMITSPWGEYTVTWNNQPSTDTAGKITLPQSISPNQNYLNIDVTSHIQHKCTNPGTHHGFMIKLVTEILYRSMIFASSDHPNPAIRPKLVITYEPPAPELCDSYSIINIWICKGDSALIKGVYQQSSGVFFDTLVNHVNKDSIVMTALFVKPQAEVIRLWHLCDGDSISLAGNYCIISGFYTEIIVNQHGCDTLIHNLLEVTIIDKTITISGNTLLANEPGATYQWVDCDAAYTPIPGAVFQSFTPATNGNFAVIISRNGCSEISECVQI